MPEQRYGYCEIHPGIDIRLLGEYAVNESDHLSLRIDKRTTRGTGIDGRIRLHEIFNGVETDISAVNG